MNSGGVVFSRRRWSTHFRSFLLSVLHQAATRTKPRVRINGGSPRVVVALERVADRDDGWVGRKNAAAHSARGRNTAAHTSLALSRRSFRLFHPRVLSAWGWRLEAALRRVMSAAKGASRLGFPFGGFEREENRNGVKLTSMLSHFRKYTKQPPNF